MIKELKAKLQHIPTDKIDYNEFYTITYGEDWNSMILTDIDKDEKTRILFTCMIYYKENLNMNISALWIKINKLLCKLYPDDLHKFYTKDLSEELGINNKKLSKYYQKSLEYKNSDNILDMFYKWIYNEHSINIKN